jgi:hypothetical protein
MNQTNNTEAHLENTRLNNREGRKVLITYIHGVLHYLGERGKLPELILGE